MIVFFVKVCGFRLTFFGSVFNHFGTSFLANAICLIIFSLFAVFPIYVDLGDCPRWRRHCGAAFWYRASPMALLPPKKVMGVKSERGSYLGGAARSCVCSHDVFPPFFSGSTLPVLSYGFSCILIYWYPLYKATMDYSRFDKSRCALFFGAANC